MIDLAAQITDGLAAAHALGISHRDLKPENIMLTRDGRAKILDFGLAKHADPVVPNSETRSLTEQGTILGTIGYMSPEQVRGQIMDHRSDIFSFGLVLYELLAGKRAFERPAAADVLSAILKEDPPALPESVPPALRQVVQHCLEKDPGHRFQSAKDLGFALRTLEGSATISTMLPVVSEKRHFRRLWLWAPVVACVAGAGVALKILPSGAPDTSRIQFTPIAVEAATESHPAFSPDGKSIAYLRRTGGTEQLFVRRLDADLPVQITNGAQINTHFWSPDGGAAQLFQWRESRMAGLLLRNGSGCTNSTNVVIGTPCP